MAVRTSCKYVNRELCNPNLTTKSETRLEKLTSGVTFSTIKQIKHLRVKWESNLVSDHKTQLRKRRHAQILDLARACHKCHPSSCYNAVVTLVLLVGGFVDVWKSLRSAAASTLRNRNHSFWRKQEKAKLSAVRELPKLLRGQENSQIQTMKMFISRHFLDVMSS